jgi:hypothetical protein
LVYNKYKTSSAKITNFIISCFFKHPALCGDWEEAPLQNFQKFLVYGGVGYIISKPPEVFGRLGYSPLAFAPGSKQECGGLIKPLTMADYYFY